MPLPDYYRILGISPTADSREIKTAYHRLALQYHPDLHPNNPEAEETLKLINQAYGVLSNPLRRRWYDTQTVIRPTTENSYTPPRYTWSYPNRGASRPADSADQIPKFHRGTVLATWIIGLFVLLFISLWFGPLRSLRFGQLPIATPQRITHQLKFATSTPYTRLLFTDVNGITYSKREQVPKERFSAGQTLIISYTTSLNAGRVFIGVTGSKLQVGSTAPFAAGQWIPQSDHGALNVTIPTSDDYAIFLNLDHFTGSVQLNWAIKNP